MLLGIQRRIDTYPQFFHSNALNQQQQHDHWRKWDEAFHDCRCFPNLKINEAGKYMAKKIKADASS